MICVYSVTAAAIFLFGAMHSQPATGVPLITKDITPTQANTPEPTTQRESLAVPVAQKSDFELLMQKAEHGDAEAQFKVGYAFYYAKGVTKNTVEAFSWFSKSSVAGNVKATFMLGAICYDNDAIENAIGKAKQFFQDSLNGLILLGDNGDSEAQRFLGHLYFLGVGIPVDFYKSFEWYKKAAEQGDVLAQYRLGQKYADGQGVVKDEKKAFEWYTKAAEQGEANAQFYLGLMYYIGESVPKDDKKAIEWFTKSAEQGATDAQYSLGVMYANGRGVSKDLMNAIEWYTKAAYLGNANAQYELGAIYEIGEGEPQNYETAYAWYLLAVVQGVEDAGKSRDKLSIKMTPKQIANAQCLSQLLVLKINCTTAEKIKNTK